MANLPFAEFFLNFILQKPNLVDDLASQVRRAGVLQTGGLSLRNET